MKPTTYFQAAFAALVIALVSPLAQAQVESSSTTVTPGTPTVIEKNNTVAAPPIIVEKKVPVDRPVIVEKKVPVVVEKVTPAPVPLVEEKTTTTTTTSK